MGTARGAPASGAQLGLLSPGSSTTADAPLGLCTSHVLGLNALEVLGLSTWGFGFWSVSSLLHRI